MKSIFYAFACTLLLSGCLSKLENATDETIAEVRKSNLNMEEMEKLQSKGGALEILSSPDKSPNVRYLAAKSIFLTAVEEKDLHTYICAELPLRDNASVPYFKGVPNVSIIQGDLKAEDTSTGLLACNEDLYNVLESATIKILRGLVNNLIKPGGIKNQKDMDDHIAYAERMLLIAPTVLGARKFDSATDTVSMDLYRSDKTTRKIGAKYMLSLLSILDKNFDEGFKNHVKAVGIEVKMKLNPAVDLN